MTDYIKPLPKRLHVAKGYWEGCKNHQLCFQQCKNCGTYRHYPRPMCPNCHSMDTQWTPVSGKGKVYSMTVAHRTIHPGFMDLPYAVVIVEMEEGIRTVGDIVNAKPDDIYIGMPVEVVFDDVTEEITLPRFRKV